VEIHIRLDDFVGSIMSATEELIVECQRLEESCNYTAVTFIIWLKWLRVVKTVCSVAPVLFGFLATWKIVEQGSPVISAMSVLLVTVIPPAYKVSKTDSKIKEYAALVSEFTSLRDRFRQLAMISSKKSFADFEKDVKPIIARLEKARSVVLTPPEICFRLARRKIQAGHYDPDNKD
jgi:hypothetical protein